MVSKILVKVGYSTFISYVIIRRKYISHSFHVVNSTVWVGCHWERYWLRHPLGGAPSVRSESSVRSRTAAGRCCRPQRQNKTLYGKTGQFFHTRQNMDNNDTYLHLSKCFVVLCLILFPEVCSVFFSSLCVSVSPPCRMLSEVRILQTDFDMLINCTCVSYRRSRVMCIDLEPVPMLKSGDKDCASQSGSGVGTLIAVM